MKILASVLLPALAVAQAPLALPPTMVAQPPISFGQRMPQLGGQGLVRAGVRVGIGQSPRAVSGRYRLRPNRYPGYYSNPWQGACVPSPWYGYYALPPYLSTQGLFAVNNAGWFGGIGWETSALVNPLTGLGTAADRLSEAFAEGDRRSLLNFSPRRGSVEVRSFGSAYRVDAERFDDLLLDLLNVRTQTFEVVSARATAPGQGLIQAIHLTNDPWNRSVRQNLTFLMASERGGWVVRGVRSGF